MPPDDQAKQIVVTVASDPATLWIAALSAVATVAAAVAAWKSVKAADRSATSAEKAASASDRSAATAEAALSEQRRAIEQAEHAAARADQLTRDTLRDESRRNVRQQVHDAMRYASDQLFEIERTPAHHPGAAKRMAEVALGEVDNTFQLIDWDVLPAIESGRLKSSLNVYRVYLAQRAGRATSDQSGRSWSPGASS